MKIIYKCWLPSSNCDLYSNNNSLYIRFNPNELRNFSLELDSVELVNQMRKLGRKIFVSLFNNKKAIILRKKTCLETTSYNKGIFDNYNYYKDDLINFILKYGIPIYSQSDYEKYDLFFDNPMDCEDTKFLNPLIESALTIFIVETLRVGTDKNVLPKIYKELKTNNNNDIIFILNNLILNYSNYSNIDNISIISISLDNISYQREVISIVNGMWCEYYNLVYSKFSSIKQCCICGGLISEEENLDYIDAHNSCLEEYRIKLIKELDKKISKETNPKKIKKYDDKKIEYENDINEVYKKFKMRLSWNKYDYRSLWNSSGVS